MEKKSRGVRCVVLPPDELFPPIIYERTSVKFDQTEFLDAKTMLRWADLTPEAIAVDALEKRHGAEQSQKLIDAGTGSKNK